MFNGAQNVVVTGGTFVANAENPTFPILRPLLDRVALNAILNAGGRADEVGCYPGTREMVIGQVERWMDGQSEPDHRMFWLSAPAGAGKSAIMQTVAERSKERGTHAANFFFFRDDGTRNNAQPLVATLVYQLLDFYPTLHEHLRDCLTTKPLTYKASTKEQFIQFMSSPFKIIQHPSSAPQPIILIVDGLDECNDEREQGQILKSLQALVDGDNSPFRVLVASRAEHHLQTFFNKKRTFVESIFLDGTFGPEDDIRRFVIAKFDEIKQSHPLSHRLSEDWPTKADIDAITSKSSGQFIYAATVMRFIQYSSGSPALSLRTIHGVKPSAGNNPLAHLNAVYSYVFSKACDIQAVKAILCVQFIIEYLKSVSARADFEYLLQLVGYEAIEVESYFADLVAIAQVTTAPHIALVFYHASLPDYLKDKSQSGIYHVDVGEIARELSLICLKKFHDYRSFHHTILVLDSVKLASTELSKSLLEASTHRFNAQTLSTVYNDDVPAVVFGILPLTLETLYFKTDRILFKRLLRDWIRFAYINHIWIDRTQTAGFDTLSAELYFRWYTATEKAKFALRLSK